MAKAICILYTIYMLVWTLEQLNESRPTSAGSEGAEAGVAAVSRLQFAVVAAGPAEPALCEASAAAAWVTLQLASLGSSAHQQ